MSWPCLHWTHQRVVSAKFWMLKEWLPHDVWHCQFGGCSSLDVHFLVLLIGWTAEDGPKEKLAQVPPGCEQEYLLTLFILQRDQEQLKWQSKRCHLVWQSRVEIKDYSTTYFIISPRSKCRTTELQWRAELIYALRQLIRYSCIYKAHMSPTLYGSWAVQHFKYSNTIKIDNGTICDFYTRLSRVLCVVLDLFVVHLRDS